MDFVLENGYVYDEGNFVKKDVYVKDGKMFFSGNYDKNVKRYDISDMYVLPGLCDVHVHLREPGFSYKETIKTGSKACAKGGFTKVLTMPNLNPVPDSYLNLKEQLDIIKKDSVIDIIPFGAITIGEKGEELSKMDETADYVCGFSDDGKGVQNEDLMIKAMEKAKALGKIISAHCEDNSLLNGGYIHAGEYAKKHSHKGIVSESEYLPIKRNIESSKKTGCKYHVCHISAKESVELIRNAKKMGIDITCETAPHYLVFSDNDLIEDGRFKMNPPIRSSEDRESLILGLKDGTIDMIATDHSPHSDEEKSKGLEKSLMGVVGIEYSFAVMYTYFVRNKIINLKKLVELMWKNPNLRFFEKAEFKEGTSADFAVFNLNESFTVTKEDTISKGKATPFLGHKLFGRCKLTVYKGEQVWKENLTEK